MTYGRVGAGQADSARRRRILNTARDEVSLLRRVALWPHVLPLGTPLLRLVFERLQLGVDRQARTHFSFRGALSFRAPQLRGHIG